MRRGTKRLRANMCDATQFYVRHDSLIIYATRRIRLVGSLKLWVSFAKEPYKRDDILQNRPIVLRSLLIIATPYK